jgi:hypothetical protein
LASWQRPGADLVVIFSRIQWDVDQLWSTWVNDLKKKALPTFADVGLELGIVTQLYAIGPLHVLIWRLMWDWPNQARKGGLIEVLNLSQLGVPTAPP